MISLAILAAAAADVTPKTDPSTWIRSDDYPKSAIESDKDGTLIVAISVDEKGNPSSCSVTSSSGDLGLDDLTCSLLKQRAQFIPARNQNRRSVSSQCSQKITWRIPREKLITQGFKLTFEVDNSGNLSNCSMIKYEFNDNDLQCNSQGVDAIAGKMLPKPLGSYKSISLMLAMEVEQSTIAIPRQVVEDRTIISSATAGISAKGVVATCKAEVTREWMGKSSDLCSGPITVGEKAFDLDPQGRNRQVKVTLEISGTPR